MIITRLVVENFGVFCGRNEIDLRPIRGIEETPPVILFGGKNGAGKTTILEAVRLCLYGRTALGQRVRKVDYYTHLHDRIHRPVNNDSIGMASVQIAFEYVHAGVLSSYDAQRVWKVDGRNVHEQIFIYKDGRLFEDIDAAHWDEFLRDLIPPGVADLFFFDGEQIQVLADEDTEAGALKTAVDGLLNLNLVERLKTDLELYVRQQAQQERSNLLQQAERLYTEFTQLEQRISEVKQDRAGLVSKLDQVRKKTETARQALVHEGASFLQHRAALEAEQKDIDKQIEATRNEIREMVAELLPFALAPRWSLQLGRRLQIEAKAEEHRFAQRVRQETAAQISQLFASESFRKRVSLTTADIHWQKLTDEVNQLFAAIDPNENHQVLHQLSVQRREQILELVGRVLDDVPHHVGQLGSILEKLEQRQVDIAHALRQIPDEALANPLIEEFQQLAQQMGELNQQVSSKDEAIRQLELSLGEIDRFRKKTWLEIASIGDVDRKVDRAAKVQVALDEYRARITAIKLEQLENRLVEYFNRLCRKQKLVRHASIDPDKFQVTLFGENGDILPKSSLSAGERQLYAMSLLWALRTVSGRQLPIIVDTPMGRLDTDHRRTLLTEFFPHAAHQLILLSTDTEIDADGYELLAPSISREYLLTFDMESNSTIVEQRYFTELEHDQ